MMKETVNVLRKHMMKYPGVRGIMSATSLKWLKNKDAQKCR